MLNRMYHHSRRFKREFIVTSTLGIAFAFIVGGFYSAIGEDGVRVMFRLIADAPISGLFPGFDTNSPGWILWLTFMLGFIIYFLFAVTGINLGSKVLPTVEEDAVETFLGSTSLPARTYYVENYLAAILSQIAMMIPLYLIIIVYTIFVHDSANVVGRITLVFIATIPIGVFFITITSVGSVLRFSKTFGKGVGFGYLLFAFIIDTLSGAADFKDYANISVNHYLNSIGVIIDIFEWGHFFALLGISLVVFAIGLWKVKDADFIERAGSTRKLGGITNPLSGVISSPFAPKSFLGKKYPLFSEQMRRDTKAILVLVYFIIFQQFAILTALPGSDELAGVIAQSDNPALSAFSQNHPVQESLLGFLVLKFYAVMWLYFGIITAVIAASITSRDVRTNTHDLMFANDISLTKLVFSRTLSMITTISIIVFTSFFAIRGLQAGKVEIDFGTQLGLFVVLWIHYIGMGIFLVGISLIPLVSKGKSIAMYTFIFFVVFSFVPFMSANIEFLKYLSYISYFDPVGIIYGVVDFVPSLIKSTLMLLGSTGFTAFMIKIKFAKTDFR